jgi:transposase
VAEGDVSGDKKKAAACRGIILFEDEASFWLDGTLHQTWARVGCQPRVDTFGARKTAHLFAAVSLCTARFSFQFAQVFNAGTFLTFLKRLVAKYAGRKVFLIIDNAPCHNLDDAGRQWLADNQRRISLHRLPPYSPEFNPVEPIWKTTRKLTTHNRFYRTTVERDTALRNTFARFRRTPSLIAAHVARFQ